MVALIMNKEGRDEKLPTIFMAAYSDDVVQLALCLQRGERLDDVDQSTSFTPIHLALIEGSDNFLRAATAYDFNPWIRDCNERLAIDHAAALGNREAQMALHSKMYPHGWSKMCSGPSL
jgi:ankyrin repeat protein